MNFSYLESTSFLGLPVLDAQAFTDFVCRRLGDGGRLAALFALEEGQGASLCAVVDLVKDGGLAAVRSAPLTRYHCVTAACPQAHWFEREIFEQYGVVPEYHPWLKPIRFHPEYGERAFARQRPGETNYFQVEGAEVHEVAVGPVHAGIIEPGHFRFQCYGENVMHLEISLGYQHRGIEPALAGGPGKRTLPLMETLAGDTSIGHALAHCALMETLTKAAVTPRAAAIRQIALELERLANHAGDLGALAGDVGFLPTLSYCGRIRGDFLNMTALICGNRFGRGLVRPGGVALDLDAALAGELASRLEAAARDITGAVDLLFNSASVLNRFENTGKLSAETVLDLGIVGPPARAAGVARDARRLFPLPGQAGKPIPIQVGETGDVYARALVRRREIAASIDFVRQALASLPGGETRGEVRPLPQDRLAVSFVEGWRGEICHVAVTGEDGRFRAYKPVDPSFRNWIGLAMAMRGQQISDFPLCNKSFNLSYCGHDL